MTAQIITGGLPQGELLGRYRSYEDAQKVVDHLAAAEGFDMKAITIVGNDLRSVERIRSRLSYPRVAGAGAAQGAMFGFFIGLLIWLFAPDQPVINLALSVLLGMAIWMMIGVISYAIRRGRRDFSSSSQLTATTFDVVCDFSAAGRARQLVAESGVMSLNAWNDPTGRSTQMGAPRGGAAGAAQSANSASGVGAGTAGPGGSGEAGSGAMGPGGMNSGSTGPDAGGPETGGGATSPSGAAGGSQGSANTSIEWQDAEGKPRYGVRRADLAQEAVSSDEQPGSSEHTAARAADAHDAATHEGGSEDAGEHTPGPEDGTYNADDSTAGDSNTEEPHQAGRSSE